MKVSSRFTEYGMTGAFFWLLQLLMLYLYLPDTLQLNQLEQGLSEKMNIIPVSLETFVEVIAIISIFFVGLMLDTVGAVMLMFEMKIFRNHIGFNKEWLEKLADNNKDYFLKKVLSFYSNYGNNFVNCNPLQVWRRILLVWSFIVSQTYLTSYVTVRSGDANPSFLFDRISQWRTVRAFASVLLLVLIENIVFILSGMKIQEAFSDHEGTVLLTNASLTVAACIVSGCNYKAMCDTLFTLVYVSSKNQV